MDIEKQIPKLEERMPCLNPVYPAQYDELFMEIKKNILKQDYSAETNQMVEKLLTFGETNYTCWVTKKRIWEAGNTSIQHEDIYSKQVLLDDNLKNFQLWDYRNFIVENTKDYEKQFSLMDQILIESPKNYHLWSNRTKLVKIVGNYSEEITRTQKFILNDCYNNSAWAYRAYCFKNLLIKDYKTEVQFVLEMIKKYIDNEAAWNYLRGMFPCYKLRNFALGVQKQKSLLSYEEYPQIKQFCSRIMERKQVNDRMKVQTLLTILIIESQGTTQYAKQVCGYLSELQPMRSSYYKWLQNAL